MPPRNKFLKDLAEILGVNENELSSMAAYLEPAHLEPTHEDLVNQGYQFIGYHGTSRAAAESIGINGFQPSYSGTGGGNARGRGFYISRSINLAQDWADSTTQDDSQSNETIQRQSGPQGEQQVLNIYARDFSSMTIGRDYAWGVQNSAGDPNGDRGIESISGQDYGPAASRDLELVFRFRAYRQLAAISNQPQGNGQAPWPSHTVEETSFEEEQRLYIQGPVTRQRSF